MKTVIFIHGFMGSPHIFDNLQAVARQYGVQTVTVILPGHTGPLRDFLKHGRAKWQAAVDAAVAGVEGEIIAVTHSMGAPLAMRALRGRGTLLAIAPYIALRPSPRIVGTWIKVLFAPAGSPARLACGIRGINPFTLPLLLPRFYDLYAVGRDGGFPPVKAFAFCFDRDEVVSVTAAVRVFSAMPHAEVTVLPRSRHFILDTDEEKLIAQRLAELLQQ